MSKKKEQQSLGRLVSLMNDYRFETITSGMEIRTYDPENNRFSDWDGNSQETWRGGNDALGDARDDAYRHLGWGCYGTDDNPGIRLVRVEDELPYIVQGKLPESIRAYRSSYLDQPVDEAYLEKLRRELKTAEEAQREGKVLRDILIWDDGDGDGKVADRRKFADGTAPKEALDLYADHRLVGGNQLTAWYEGETTAEEAYQNFLSLELSTAKEKWDEECASEHEEAATDSFWEGLE